MYSLLGKQIHATVLCPSESSAPGEGEKGLISGLGEEKGLISGLGEEKGLISGLGEEKGLISGLGG